MSFAGRTCDRIIAAAPEPTDRTAVNRFSLGTERESGAGGVTGRVGIIISPSPRPVMVNSESCCVRVEERWGGWSRESQEDVLDVMTCAKTRQQADATTSAQF
jgi:hypothetical protein